MIEEGLMSILHHLNIDKQQAINPSLEPLLEISHVASTAEMVDKGKDVGGEYLMVEGETFDLPSTPIRQEIFPRKLELPIFEGNNPDGWLIRVERYFELNGVSPAYRLRVVVVWTPHFLLFCVSH